MKLLDLIKGFLENPRNVILRVLAFNWTDRSQGIRSPDCPVGVIADERGYSSLYAAKNRVVADLKDGIQVEGAKVNLSTLEISLNANSVEDIDIMGNSLNPKVFDPSVYILLRKKDLSGLFVVNPDTIVVNGKLVNLTPLQDVLEPQNILIQSNKPTALSLDQIKQAASTLGIKIPDYK